LKVWNSTFYCAGEFTRQSQLFDWIFLFGLGGVGLFGLNGEIRRAKSINSTIFFPKRPKQKPQTLVRFWLILGPGP